MAKNPIDVGAKFTGDPSGFEKAAGRVKGSATALKKDIKETSGVFTEFGSSIQGMGGEIANSFSSIITAASGIGAIVVIVSELAKAWQQSQENIELYLKSADKLKAGSGGFTIDAEKARVDLRKRANGMITLGYQMEKENLSKLNLALLRKDETQAKYFSGLVKEGRLLQENGRKLRDGVIGLVDKTNWQMKFTELLKEEETLNDAALLNKERWMALEADLVKQRTIIQDKDTDSKAKAEAVVKAEQIANALLKEKNEFIDKQLANINTIAEMTQTQEVVEQKVADLQTQKNANLREYGMDMLKVLKMENKASKEIKDQKDDWKEKLRLLKEYNTHNSEGFKLEDAKIDKLEYKAPALGMPSGAGNLRPSSGLSMAEISDIVKEGKFQESLEGIQQLVYGVENAFVDLFASISAGSGNAFADMAKAFARAIKQMVAQMAAKTAIFGILSLLSGGGGAIGKFASGLLGGKKLGSFLGFAEGTNFAPGGMALVGEKGPEIVNLPRGSQVIPNRNIGFSGGTVKIKFVDGALQGQLNWDNRMHNSFR